MKIKMQKKRLFPLAAAFDTWPRCQPAVRTTSRINSSDATKRSFSTRHQRLNNQSTITNNNNNSIPASANVVICGAGIMGVATAYHLARKGVKNIVLLDKEPALSLTRYVLDLQAHLNNFFNVSLTN